MHNNIPFFISCLFLINAFCFSQNTFIPDDNFEQALIDLGFDSGPLDDFIPTSTVLGITYLDIHQKNISDLTGIEDFINLTYLNCDENNLTSLDVTKNTKLIQFYCRFNQLTTIDVTKNTALDIFWCESNQLTGLDITKNTSLISLVCRDNPLNNLDVTKNTRLNVLSCQNNLLTNLDITKNIELNRLNCDYNMLTTIDTSNNTKLTRFSCGDNLITTLDISKNKKLTWFWCTRNQLTNLDVTSNIVLEDLTFGDNKIENIDLSKNTKLITVWCAKNLLTSLDTSKNSLLKDLSCAVNKLTTLDISNNLNLISLGCEMNLLCELNVKNGNNTNFIKFGSSSNPNLTCIFVDDVAYSSSNWTNIDMTSNFVSSQNECDVFGNSIPNVDVLNDFIGANYTLPTITDGDYYTEPNGNGLLLNTGDLITSSQTIYIFNQTACFYNESSFNVLITGSDFFIPKYFTPNNDGSHDFWKVLDNTNSLESINIFNRYGKLLKALQPSQSWNGTFNGKLMQTDDYWYLIKLKSGESLKGHFTLKR